MVHGGGVRRSASGRGAVPDLDHPGPVNRSTRSNLALLLCLATVGPAGATDAGATAAVTARRKVRPVGVGEQLGAVVVPGLLLVSVAAAAPARDDGKVHGTEPLTVVVRDTRPGGVGWTLDGIAHGFAEEGDQSSSSDTIRWTPNLVDASPAMTVSVTASGTGRPIVEDPGAASRTLASSPAGKSIGTAVVQLALGVPLTDRGALFRGEVTFTVL
jgi:hypothetical protein